MVKYRFIGWCHDPVENHDKVWGVIFLEPPKSAPPGQPRYFFDYYGGEKCVSFWGRRGKKLQTKAVTNDYDLWKLIEEKKNKKNYIQVNEKKLDEVYPEFQKDLEKTAVWAMLKTRF